MPVKVKLGSRRGGFFSGLVRLVLVVGLFCVVCGGAAFAYYYFKYQTVVDDRLAKGPLFASVTQVYAAPLEVRVGQHLPVETIAANLRAAGYNADPELGTFMVRGDAILIKPGMKSYHSSDGATVTTEDGEVVSITAENGVALRAFELEPQLITALSNGKSRSKRRLVEYKDIPPRMVEAVTAIEDRRFFEHSGLNYGRLIKCGFTDLVSGHKNCGGSTLTQQLAKNIFLTPEKSVRRKMIEMLITLQLENRFTKQQLFEMYANEMNLGHQGSFEINGVGEAAETFFGKPLDKLDLAQTATLAALFQNPSYRNPYRHPERAVERRNLVLDSMVETGAISQAQADAAKAESLRLAPPNLDASEAPYFVDLVHDQVVQRIGDQNFGNQSLRIYTSLDPELQRVASEAVAAGSKNVDDLVRRKHGKSTGAINYPQIALVALDPHTGQILALVGGRNYGVSQLDHALAERPTGSIFKPFVYATAYNTSLVGTTLDDGSVFTALTKLNDDEQDFGGGYMPGNFVKGEYPGMVTAVTAIEHSLNIATIALGQKVGFDNVAALARSAGIVNARGTPSVAIGTYNATPLQMAGAYTVFANGGVHLDPWAVSSVRGVNGDLLADMPRSAKQVLDPRVAYLTQSLLQNVMTYGTAAVVRGRGFTAPAAGKTGSSHDAWFAGYSSNLLCIIWVGNDDYTNLDIEGAKAAAPIWAEFMSRAIKLPQYSDMHGFTKPDGVTDVLIDMGSNLPADSTCPKDFVAAFLDGTIPAGTCSRMNGGEGGLDTIMNGGSKNQPGMQAPPP